MVSLLCAVGIGHVGVVDVGGAANAVGAGEGGTTPQCVTTTIPTTTAEMSSTTQ